MAQPAPATWPASLCRCHCLPLPSPGPLAALLSGHFQVPRDSVLSEVASQRQSPLPCPCSLPLPPCPTRGVHAQRQSPPSSHGLARPPTPSLHPQAPLLSLLLGGPLCSPLAPDFSSCPCCLRAELPKFSVVKDAFICFVLFLVSNLLQTVSQKTIKTSQQNQIAVKSF